MKNLNIKFIAESAIIAALYVVITWLFAPISYGPIQFRISEVLVLLVVLNPKFAYALVIGCFVSNIPSSLGWYDMLFGTLATTLAIIPMLFVRKMPISAIFPVISNAFIVSLELGIAFSMWGGAYWYNVFTVALGEAVILYLLGIPLMAAIVKNEKLCELMKLDKTKSLSVNLSGYSILSAIFFVLSIILYFAYPMYSINNQDNIIDYTMFNLTKENAYWLILTPIFGLFYFLTSFTKNKIKLFLGITISICIISIQIILGITYNDALRSFYYYLYYVFPIFMILLSIIKYKNEKVINDDINNI